MTILRNPERFKAVISHFYTGVCEVEIKESVKDPETHKIRPEIKVLYTSLPCRLSHDSKNKTEAYQRNTTGQEITLFLDNKVEIPAGAKITVTQDDVTNIYGMTSEPNVFETHQEIALGKWEDWSHGYQGQDQGTQEP